MRHASSLHRPRHPLRPLLKGNPTSTLVSHRSHLRLKHLRLKHLRLKHLRLKHLRLKPPLRNHRHPVRLLRNHRHPVRLLRKKK